MSFIIPTAEPFLFSGDPTSDLLVLGLSRTLEKMHWLVEILQAQVHTMLGVHLARYIIPPEPDRQRTFSTTAAFIQRVNAHAGTT